MRYLIIGCGNIGLELARLWTDAGHHIIGTTTRDSRLPELEKVCSEALVLRGSDADAISSAAAGADAVIVTASPRFAQATNPAERSAEYRDTLLLTTAHAAAAHDHVLFASSTTVYGDGLTSGDTLTETSPLTQSTDASPLNFIAAERAALTAPHGAVVRLPDVYGHPRDIDYPQRVRLALDVLGGVVPFSPHSLLYRIDYRDAAAAIKHIIENQLSGIHNAVPDASTPPTIEAAFSAICAAHSWPALRYRSDVVGPAVPVSSARLRSTGYTFTHSQAFQLDHF